MPRERDAPPHMRARSRSRSPKREPRGERDRDYRDRGHDRRDDGGYARREGRGRDDRGSQSRDLERRGDYGVKEREKEREDDRKRYDEGGELVAAKSPPKPNFANSGLLAKESNSVKGVALKYHEPPEARKPTKNWRLYVFKGDDQVDLVHIYRQSCYLIGRDQVVTDIPIQHPSCSKQHAVIQFRQTTTRNEYGDTKTEVKPFVIDLDSTNGTYVNGKEVPKSRYYELLPSDVLKFGTSSREYVLLHEEAK